jgi:UDP-N-acetylglucosamine acyltransferase
MKNIHKTAFVHPTAVLGDFVTIGERCYIGPLCIIGYPPEWKGKEHNDCGVIIGAGTTITGLVTIDSGAIAPTTIGENCYLMKHAHVGHDVAIGNDVTISCGAKIGGHVVLHDGVNVGLNACIHQKLSIPAGVMIGMNAAVTKKTELVPYTKLAGVPARIIGDNNHG